MLAGLVVGIVLIQRLQERITLTRDTSSACSSDAIVRLTVFDNKCKKLERS